MGREPAISAASAEPALGADDRALSGLALILLGACTVFFLWFDYAAVAALLRPTTDAGGHALFQVPGFSNTVYPFTYVGVAASFGGVSYFVFDRERRRGRPVASAVLGLLVANLASIGMIDCYEQLFLVLGWSTPASHAAAGGWLALYWGSIPGAAGTAFGMVVVGTVLPWYRSENWPTTSLCLLVFVGSMLAWRAIGMGSPSTMGWEDYLPNAISRISSQLALVALVAPRDVLRMLADRRRAIRFGRRSEAPSV